MDPYAAALGVHPKANPPPAARPGKRPDVAGGVLLAQSPETQAAVLADVAKTGAKSFTFNGAAPEAASAESDPYAAALGIGSPPEPPPKPEGAPAAPVAPDGARASFGPWDDAANAAGRAGANLGNAVYGGLKGLGTLATGGGIDAAAEATKSAPIPLPKPTRATEQLEKAFAKLQEPLEKAADWAQLGTEDTGAAGAGVMGAMAKAGIVNLPALLAVGPRGAKGARGALEEQFAAKKAPPVRIEPTMGPSVEVKSMNFAPVDNSPAALKAGGFSPPTKVEPIKLEFTDSAPAAAEGRALPKAEQIRRAQVLQSVGLENVRNSALAGDAKAAATDLQTSKLDNKAGNMMREQLDAEKSALSSHSEGLVRNTGGTHGLDQSATYARGNSIVAPLDSLKEYFDRRTSELYKAADERAQGVPTELDNFRKVLGDDSQMTNADRVHLRSAVNSYAKQLNLIAEDGKVFSNAQQAETMRKFLGENWSPQNGRFVGKLKEALDKDVMAAAGEDVYSQARSLWKEKADTLDNPNGIAKILDASGPEGINRAIPIEKIADSIAGMPVKQLSHVLETLKNVPAEIQPLAAQALSEVKAQFANKVHSIGTSQQGQWNAKGVTRYLNDNAERMKLVFSPEEISAFKNLNEAGHILAKDQSYPGAAVQQHNLVKAGVAHGLQAAGASVGGLVAGPAGAAVGGFLGNRTAAAIGEAASTRAAKSRLTRLSEIGRTPEK